MGQVRVFKSSWFQRFANKERIDNTSLQEAVNRAESGLVDANIGGGVIKQRIGRKGEGKSGGYRTVILFRKGTLAFFVYGFSKSDRDNFGIAEERAFKKAAGHLLALNAKQIETLVKQGAFHEVKSDEQ